MAPSCGVTSQCFYSWFETVLKETNLMTCTCRIRVFLLSLKQNTGWEPRHAKCLEDAPMETLLHLAFYLIGGPSSSLEPRRGRGLAQVRVGSVFLGSLFVFLWFSFGFPLALLLFSLRCPSALLWISFGFPSFFVFLWFSFGSPDYVLHAWFSFGFPLPLQSTSLPHYASLPAPPPPLVAGLED